MCSIKKFQEDPEKFLEKRGVIVLEVTNSMLNHKKGVHKFRFTNINKSWVSLEWVSEQYEDRESTKAYFLPYVEDKVTSLTLGNQANLFFTAELTNCRFTVVNDDPKAPTVMHTAGGLVRNVKNTKEGEELRSLHKQVQPALIRRLSISGSEAGNVGSPKYKGWHQYTGQESKVPLESRSSAFVFGYIRYPDENNKDNYVWEFKAQVSKGVQNSVRDVTENLQRLGYVDILHDESTEGRTASILNSRVKFLR